MKTIFGITMLVVAAGVSLAADALPEWAYSIGGTYGNDRIIDLPEGAPPPPKARPNPDEIIHLPGSTLAFPRKQLTDSFGPADWFPDAHPVMPDIVAHGRKPNIQACATCHGPTGNGRPQNAPLTGLPTSYFLQQIEDFKNGNRKSADKRKANTYEMARYAKAMTDDEAKAAAAYFAQIEWTTPWVKVMEVSIVPKTRSADGLLVVIDGGGEEPLGQRIIETPVDTQTAQYHDPRSGFIAYVPVGSLKKGEALVTTGGGKTTQCGICHGADLKGTGPVPGIAGRSPSYLVRQLYDIQEGVRNGLWTGLMKPVVSKLNEEDMLNIAAYAASLMP